MTMTATGTVHFDTAHPAPADQGELSPIGVPFTKVPTAVVRGQALGLSSWAKLLYVVLCSYADPAGACYPGYATLRADIGCGLNQLTRAMRELEAAGLVTRRRRGQGHSTRYALHAPGRPSAAPVLIHAQRESRVAPGVKLESLPRGVEQDSGNQDPGEQHHPVSSATLAPIAPDNARTSSANDDALVAALRARGITPRIAQRLVATSPPAIIGEQLAWQGQRPVATNPAGALVQAIRERWPAPPGVAAAQARTVAVQQQAEEARRREQEEAARRQEWEAKPAEERIAGRLTFWIQGRRAKRHEPTAAEIAARRTELLAELGAVGGAAAPVTG
jgi:hypothetical protein